MLLLEIPSEARGLGSCSEATGSVGPQDAPALAALALPVHANLSVSESLVLGKQGLELALQRGDAAELARAASNLGIAALASGRDWGWSLVEQGLSAAEAVADRRESTRISINAAIAALWLGEHARALSLFEDLRLVVDATGCSWLEDRVGVLGAELSRRTKGEATSQPSTVAPFDPSVASLQGRLALEAGDLDWAELMLLPVAERGFDEGFPDLAASASACLAEIAMQEGDLQASISWAGRAVAPARMGAVAWWGDVLAPAVAALCRHEMVREAAQIVMEAEAALREATAPRARAALLQANGLLAEADGRPTQARSMYAAASRRFADLPDLPTARACALALSRA